MITLTIGWLIVVNVLLLFFIHEAKKARGM